MSKKIGITLGDPAGVGPELILKISRHFKKDFAYVIYGEEKTLLKASELTGITLTYEKVDEVKDVKESGIYLVDLKLLKVPVVEPSPTSGKIAIAYLARAVADAVRGNLQGILTMPISKFWAKKAGFQYEGQTEYLAKASGTKEYAMMMYSKKLKVVLLTTHLPLKDVPKFVKKEKILKKIRLIKREFLSKFKAEPLIKVLGLNPHAGEMGELGREEIEEIIPAVEEAKKEGIKVEGPLIPDVAFINPLEKDVFLCMYHDQGLIPFKMLAFNEGVNFTL
ncbi:MAG: 4-hydroxythreonine-4-phosphate dehydrogenase PdxA, partial [Aquifex sp.]